MKKWYTNGTITKKLDLDAGDVLPEGFYPGRTCTYKPWNKGLTKETNESLLQVSQKVQK